MSANRHSATRPVGHAALALSVVVGLSVGGCTSLALADATDWTVADSAIAEAKKAPSDTKVTFYVGLERAERKAMDKLTSVSDPTSPNYRHFPGRKKIRHKYGATVKALTALRDSADDHGLSVGLDTTGVYATVFGTAERMGRWLGKPVKVASQIVGGLSADIYHSGGRPPKPVRPYVREFVALDLKVEAATTAAAANPEAPYDGVNRGTPQGCLGDVVPGGNKYIYSYNELRTAYGIDDLPDGRKVGKAARVVILAQGDGFSGEALKASANCFDLPGATFVRKPVQGLKTTLPEGGEGDLDVQVVQSVMPAGSTVKVVEAAGFDERNFLPWALAYGASQLPDVITTSYGNCEAALKQLPPGVISLTESVLLRLGLAGTSTFSAAGDRGSSDCINNETGQGPKRLAVDYPGSSPYVTSVGGTRLEVSADNTRSDEVVWNSTWALPPNGPEAVAGGGGTSALFARPWWQPKSTTKSSMRTVPDVAAAAAPAPGWPLFAQGDGGLELLQEGGTSAATPFTAASVGILAARQRLKGAPGFGALQPALYRMHSRSPATFFDVVEGGNDLFDKGCCNAAVGYDKASGLGAPNFARWASKMSKPAK